MQLENDLLQAKAFFIQTCQLVIGGFLCWKIKTVDVGIFMWKRSQKLFAFENLLVLSLKYKIISLYTKVFSNNL